MARRPPGASRPRRAFGDRPFGDKPSGNEPRDERAGQGKPRGPRPAAKPFRGKPGAEAERPAGGGARPKKRPYGSAPAFVTEDPAEKRDRSGWAKASKKKGVLRAAKHKANAKRRESLAEDPAPAEAPPQPPKRPIQARFGKYGTETAPEAGRPKPRIEAPLPSTAELRAYLRSVEGRVGKTEIARHFGLSTDQRPALRELLARMKAEGSAAPAGKKQIRAAERLAEMAVVEVFGSDPEGDALARPVQWDPAQGRPPIIFMRPEKRGEVALMPGERVLARLKHLGGDKYEGKSFKRLGSGEAPKRILGVFEEGRIIPTDRRQKGEWVVPRGAEGGASPGEIVLAEPIPGARPLGPRPAQIVERLGRMGEPRSVSLICIHAHGIPDVFPAEAVQEAEKAKALTVRGRDDLRKLPLVTIDGEDARDFDDAVHAERDGSGWKITVAIADVAHYVKPDSHLDREAWARGNSVYFPDRVVPMLPEALSNGWCSLRPNEPRGCLYVEMLVDAGGQKTSHRFGRGLMRSQARLTYEQAQQHADAGTEPEGLAPGHMAALYGAFRALLAARERRGTLDLDIAERRVLLSPEGKVLAVVPRPRLDSHRLIEEFMVLANVCAAEELERLNQPCMYRVHAPPSDQKQEGLRQFLASLDLSLAPKDQLHPRDFAALLAKVRGTPHERIVNETVLRSQSQAAYEPDNIGHFGLGLARYAHFTSPIRRYADLLVHRALIRGLKLGSTGGLTEAEAARFPDTAEHITSTERRAAQAERDAVDRYLAAFMAERVGHVFDARISGVTRFGLFVTVEENGASGLVPLASLPDDRWDHDEAGHRLAGRRTGLTFSLGEAVEARLVEATPRTGGMVFALMQGVPARAPHRPRGADGGKPPKGKRARR
jgi:ribonuclease R